MIYLEKGLDEGTKMTLWIAQFDCARHVQLWHSLWTQCGI